MDRGRRRCARHLGRFASMLRCERRARCHARWARGGIGGADGAAGHGRAAGQRPISTWWAISTPAQTCYGGAHCIARSLYCSGWVCAQDEQHQCTGFRARGLAECGELGVQLRGHCFAQSGGFVIHFVVQAYIYFEKSTDLMKQRTQHLYIYFSILFGAGCDVRLQNRSRFRKRFDRYFWYSGRSTLMGRH